MGTLYRVVDWDGIYENNRSRARPHLQWVLVPIKMDGDGYTELVSHKNGAQHLAAWHVILKVAARCNRPDGGREDENGKRIPWRDGTLLRENGQPYDPATLARISRLPASLFEEALPRLVSIGWLEVVENTTDAPRCHQGGKGVPTEWQRGDTPVPESDQERIEGREEKELKVAAAPQVVEFFDLIPEPLQREPFLTKWGEWLAYRRRAGKRVSEDAARKQLANCGKWGMALSCQAVEHSIASDYQGLYPPKTGTATQQMFPNVTTAPSNWRA